MNKEMLKGTVDMLILSVLNRQDNYGYGISRTIKAQTGGAFEMLEATMYLALKRLEGLKAIEPYQGGETGDGRRKYFRITRQGKVHLARLTRDWKETARIVERFL
ncbi:MAG: PadR family transcriptional regulator [Christensenellales bacterium]